MKSTRARTLAGLFTATTFAAIPTSAHASPPGEYGYYNDSAIFFASAGTMVDAPENVLEEASPIYLLAFAVPPGTDSPITLPSGYQPQENGNFQVPNPFHDHVLTRVPGDAGYEAPLRVVVLRYTLNYQNSLTFQPVTSVAGIAAGESAGIFQTIAPDTSNPYERWLPDVLVRPVVSR